MVCRFRGSRMRILTLAISVALALCGRGAATLAQDVEYGRRVSERWCSECHAIDPGKPSRTLSFAAIAGRPGVTADMIRSFLLMPHSTMPNLPLTRKDAQDIAAFIMGMKK
jgi:mono/diheme cytochrome c family protein